MVKLKVGFSFLVVLQIFILPQFAKCSPLDINGNSSITEELERSKNVDGQGVEKTTGDGDEIEVSVSDLNSEFVIPIQVFATVAEDLDDKNVETLTSEVKTSLLDILRDGKQNFSNIDEDEIISIIEDRIASLSETEEAQENEELTNGDIEIVEVFTPDFGPEFSIPVQFFVTMSDGIIPENLETNNNPEILVQTSLDILENIKQSLSKDNQDDIVENKSSKMVNETEGLMEMDTSNPHQLDTGDEDTNSNTSISKNSSEKSKPPSKRNIPEVISVTVTAPKRKHIHNEYVRQQATYAPQYTTYQPKAYIQSAERYNEEPIEILSYVEPTPFYSTERDYYNQPLTITVDQSGRSSSYLNNIYKRSADYSSLDNYLELLKIHDAFDMYSPSPLDHSHSNNLYSLYKRNSDSDSVGKYKEIKKRSATCGCSSCSKTTDSSCSPEIIEKPTFIIEEAPETVEKPTFKVTETSETVTKPDFVVKEVTEVVPKPNFLVQEKVENVVKPNFVVEEASEKIKKPAFKVEEKPEVVVKPEFVIEENPEYIEKPEFTIEENVETVVKPKFRVETKIETVEKPNYVVKEHVLPVPKPEFVVTEKTEKVEKPEFNVEEKVEVVKKPKYEIQEQIVPIVKPNFIVEQTEVVVEKPEFIVTEEILPVQKPQYLIKETQEVVEKPEFYVTEIIETVDKPNYLVEETQQTVTKPSFNIEDDQQTVKKPQFVVQEQAEYVVKPEFVVEETTISVVKPEYVVEEVVENVQKPSYLVQPVPCYVEKPEFIVHEVVEKVNKPSFKVVEKKETVKKPSFVVEEDVQTVVKPCFNVVTCSGTPRRIPPTFSRSSHGRTQSGRHYSRRPAHKRRRSQSQHYQHKKTSSHSSAHHVE
ncbi:hypothetical protein M8J77_007829 [Diaphorina citri]|nr:hypothetical protein M8J77_007829 [Diaphorina citri]